MYSLEMTVLAVTEASFGLLDLPAAFDNVTHQIFISTLDNLKIERNTLTKVSSYLQDWSYVYLNFNHLTALLLHYFQSQYIDCLLISDQAS